MKAFIEDSFSQMVENIFAHGLIEVMFSQNELVVMTTQTVEELEHPNSSFPFEQSAVS
jgi:hypothetical protein